MAKPTITDITEGKVAGNGIFDQLMYAVEAHIHQEYQHKRITGQDYSKLYLGALQSTLDQTLRFITEREQAELIQKQIELADKQILKADKEIALMDEQILKIQAETALITQQQANAVKEGVILDLQDDKLSAEISLLGVQELKVTAEKDLLAQKKITEQAQTQSGIAAADSVVGNQNALYAAQKDGFTRDAEQKAARILVDTFNIRATQDGTVTADYVNHLSDEDIGRVIDKLMTGVGTSPAPAPP